MKTKKAIITIALVPESQNRLNKTIEKEIANSLSKTLPTIPWFAWLEKVTVVEH